MAITNPLDISLYPKKCRRKPLIAPFDITSISCSDFPKLHEEILSSRFRALINNLFCPNAFSVMIASLLEYFL